VEVSLLSVGLSCQELVLDPHFGGLTRAIALSFCWTHDIWLDVFL